MAAGLKREGKHMPRTCPSGCTCKRHTSKGRPVIPVRLTAKGKRAVDNSARAVPWVSFKKGK